MLTQKTTPSVVKWFLLIVPFFCLSCAQENKANKVMELQGSGSLDKVSRCVGKDWELRLPNLFYAGREGKTKRYRGVSHIKLVEITDLGDHRKLTIKYRDKIYPQELDYLQQCINLREGEMPK